ncbi:MAG TPA: hypothetical protein VM120_16400 [Bryobacteraceae bacterium]|nr:hypothetical protein [Bryobacteraceae bacterium]
MPCLLLIVVLAFPRIVLLVLFFTSTYLHRAYHGLILPLVGFFFLPITTLTYAWLVNTAQPFEGLNLALLLLSVLFDIGGLGGGAFRRRK